MRVLMVPGIGGSDQRHWQTLWEGEPDIGASRISPTSWNEPDHDDWLDAISRAATPDTVIVAHSLGCLAATSWLSRAGRGSIAGVFLVSPPDPTGPAFPAAAQSFRRVSVRLPVPALVVASRDDPFVDPGVARQMAREWGAEFVEAGALGHINSDSGLGHWPAGRALLEGFIESLDGLSGSREAVAESPGAGGVRIAPESPEAPDVQELLAEHLRDMFATSPPESVHALPAAELSREGITFWTARSSDGTLLGCGAVRHLDQDAAELKSMRTAPAARGRGVGTALLEHLIDACRRRGYRSVHLETGSEEFFAPARRLYARAGFVVTPPFADYTEDPNSTYMALSLG